MSKTDAPVKAIKTGKQSDQPETRRVSIRGIEYTIRELDVNEYDECIEAAQDENGSVPFGKLLRQMVARAVRPVASKPLAYPVYRTLEEIVNEMHYTTVETEDGDEEADRPNV